MSIKPGAARPGIVMPISSVVLVAIVTFGLGIWVGFGLAPTKGVEHSHEEMSQQAEIDSDRVLQAIATSDSLDMLVGIGNEMFDAGRPDLAIPAYEKVLNIEPNDANVRTDLGIMYKDAGRVDEALEQFRQAIRIDPKHENSHYNLGIVLLHNKKDVPGAVAAWEEYLRNFPNGQHAKLVRDQLKKMKAGQPLDGGM